MKFFLAAVVIILLSGIGGCKKDSPDLHTGNKSLSIKLNETYLGAAQIDSAFALWKTKNGEQRIKFRTSNDSLLIDMDQFTEGEGELFFFIYSNKKYSNQYYGQWFAARNAVMLKTKNLNYQGPVSFYDAGWYPRVQLNDAIGHEAIIALRPDDAYFIVKNPGHTLTRLVVDRGYWKTVGGIQLAGRDVWECMANCTGKINNDFFKSLPGRIGNKPWNHISIAILFEINDNGEGWILSLEHEP